MSYPTIKLNLFLEKDFIKVRSCSLATGLKILSKKIPISILNKQQKERDILTIGINIVSKETITYMNNKYIGHKGSTDVISFTYDDNILYGEIFVCPYTVSKNAKAFGVTFCNELYRVIIHGILHVLGFNHSKAMFAKQEQLLDNVLSNM